MAPSAAQHGNPAGGGPSANGEAAKASGPLIPQHLADLRGSGLSDEQIAACRFRSVRGAEAAELLGWKYPAARMGQFLAFPFFAPDGSPLPYTRLKPDRPRTDKRTGKICKYESPRQTPNRVYLPPATRAALADPAIPLLITEGEKKAAKADQEGFACVGLVGVWGWQQAKDKADGPDAPRRLAPDLAAVAWRGRAVYVVYDSDLADKPEIAFAEWHCAETLKAEGADVKVVRLPPGPPGPDGKPAKQGLDDFLVAHGPDAFRLLLAAALAPQRPAGAAGPADETLPPDEADDDPHRLARVYRARCRVAVQSDGKTTWANALVYHAEEFLRWSAGAYRPLGDAEVKAELTAAVKREFDRVWRKGEQRRREKKQRQLQGDSSASEAGEADGEKEDKEPPPVRKVTGPLIRDVTQALASVCLVPSAVEPPAWIGPDPFPWPVNEMLSAPNCLLHLPSLVAGKPCFVSPNSGFFTRNALDYDIDLKAPEPQPKAWLAFLNGIWPDDPEAVAALQEWFGYCLLPDTKQQKILMVVGPKRSGKGTIARVLSRLVGAANVVAPTLAGLAERFGLQQLIGKAVAVISDARLSGRTDAAVVVERLLSVSGEDAQTIDRKNMSHVTAKLTARFTILTNELPRLNDPSGAMTSRLIVLRMKRSWLGSEDTSLTEKLLAELPGILLWAITGFARLRERGRFQQPESARQLLESMEDLSSPIGAFIREKCTTGPVYETPVDALFAAWRTWCVSVGRREAGTVQSFGRDLRAALPHLEARQPRSGGGRVRVYAGIRLNAEEVFI